MRRLLLLVLVACNSSTERAGPSAAEPRPGETAPQAGRAPLVPPAVRERRIAKPGIQDLRDLGIAAVIAAPAGARLAWLDGSPELFGGERVPTVRLTHELDPEDGLLRAAGVRVFVRRPTRREPTELAAFKRRLAREARETEAELAAGHRELDELDRELERLEQITGAPSRERAPREPDEGGPLELEIVHERETPTGWELVWTMEEDGAYSMRVWRADLKLFCLDVLATEEAQLRGLDACGSLRAPR